jgi:V/A-type H+-transporting ATPase subunit F
VDYFFIGDAELVTAFRFIGIDGTVVNSSAEAIAVFRKITEGWNEDAGVSLPDNIPGADNCRILIVTEETADWLGDYMIKWQIYGHYPLLVEIPGITGKIAGRKHLVDSIREAIGLHI